MLKMSPRPVFVIRMHICYSLSADRFHLLLSLRGDSAVRGTNHPVPLRGADVQNTGRLPLDGSVPVCVFGRRGRR